MRVCTSCRKLLKADASRCVACGAAFEEVETLPAGTRLGTYRIDRMLGEGGMGFVYEATHEVLNRRSAIKMLRPELALHPHIVTRFLNEAKAVNLIDHQHIVNVYDYGDSEDGSVYFVMEFLEGETLDELMNKRRPMPIALLLHVFGQIARALAAAHAKQIVHRDLKPANVYVIAREEDPYFIKLLDFGIAQLRGAGAVQGLTLAGSVMGTPQYMSPEQISGGTVDARSDVWAMGVMLYRAATGHPPFPGEEFAELADRILHHVPRPAGELVAMPRALSQLIASCLERRVDARCPSVIELIAGIERVKRECQLDDDAILAQVTADAEALGRGTAMPWRDPTRRSLSPLAGRAAAKPAAGPGRSRKLWWYGGAVVVVAALGGVGFSMTRGKAGKADNHTVGPGPIAPPEPDTMARLVAEGKLPAARALAEHDLRARITSGSLQDKGFAVEALAAARVPAGAPLLYAALAFAEVKIPAARALCELQLPDAAPKIVAALDNTANTSRAELAAAAFCLGNKDARKALLRSLDELANQLTAAETLARAGDDAGRAVLVDTMATLPPGRDQWRRAAGALVKLGDAGARKALEAELPQSDAGRAIGAAERLAAAGDDQARAQLARSAADPSFARQGDAASALARLGDPRALDWVAAGLASKDGDERRLAAAICGLLPAGAKPHVTALAERATNDPELRVRLTAEAALLGL